MLNPLIIHQLSNEQTQELLHILKSRFENNMNRHKDLVWAEIQVKIETNIETIWSLNQMEKTGGEPDVISYDRYTDEYIFCDCSTESPSGRRSLCYDTQAWESRKENKPKNSAVGMATEMGVELLTEEQYRELQKLGNFDTKTSSWIMVPPKIRKLGGAIFADCRYERVFVYYNGAESYYATRGFRGILRV